MNRTVADRLASGNLMSDRERGRFMDRVKFDPATGCWNWRGSFNSSGYGQIYAGGKLWQAHRLVYEHCIGPIPINKVIDHLCGQRGCVAPHHLHPTSSIRNMKRGSDPWEGV